MRLSHLTLLHKGQTSTRYYRWMTRFPTLLILMTTIFFSTVSFSIRIKPLLLFYRSGGWVWVQSYATIVHNRSSHSLPFLLDPGHSLPFFIFISTHAVFNWLCLFESKSFTLIGCLDRLKNWRLNWIEFLSFQPFLTTSLHRGGQLCSVRPRARWPCSKCWTGGRYKQPLPWPLTTESLIFGESCG